MKKQYTKKQIKEAIARWGRTLRRMNEDGMDVFNVNRPELALSLVGKICGDSPQSLFEIMTYLYASGADELTSVQRAGGRCALLKLDIDEKGPYIGVKTLNARDLVPLADQIEAVKRQAAANKINLDPSPRRWRVAFARIKDAAGEEFLGWTLDGAAGELTLYMESDDMPIDFDDIDADAEQYVKGLNAQLDRKAHGTSRRG